MWTNSIVYTFGAIFFVYFNTSKSNLLQILLAGSGSAFFKLLDPVTQWEEQLDPDLQKMNADPQPWSHLGVMKSLVLVLHKPGIFT